MNDSPATREIYGGFTVERVDLSYTAGGSGKAKKAGEIIVTGGGKR